MEWQNLFEFILENEEGIVHKIVHNWQVKVLGGTIGACLVSFYEYAGAPLVIFLFLMTLDFLSKMMAMGHQDMLENNRSGTYVYAIWRGLCVAKSLPMRTKGINKIVQYVFILTAAALLGKLIPASLSEYSSVAFDWMLFYLSIGEAKSVFENLQEAGMEEAAFFARLFADKKNQLEDKMKGK